MKKENQRVTLTKRLLQESLLDLLDEKELHKVSVTELCSIAGINRTTFYAHYGCPQDVLADMEKDLTRRIRAEFESESILTPHGLKNAIIKACVLVRSDGRLAKLLFSSSSDPGFVRKATEATSFIAELDRYLAAHFDEGERALVTAYVLNGSYCLMRQWLADGAQTPPEEIAELISRLSAMSWMFQKQA